VRIAFRSPQLRVRWRKGWKFTQ